MCFCELFRVCFFFTFFTYSFHYNTNDKPFCKTAVSKKCVRRVDLHVLQNMTSGHRLLSAFRFLSYLIKIIKVIIHKYKISKSKDKKICRDWGSNFHLQNFGTEVYDLTTAPAQL